MITSNGFSNYQNYTRQARSSSPIMMDQKNDFSTKTGEISGNSSNKPIIIKLGALDSGGDGRGAYFNMVYDETSTDENPVILAEGVDEHGTAFKKKINVNNVNPSYASYIEMRALAAHTKTNTFASPGAMGSGGHSYLGKENYVKHFDKIIKDHKTLKNWEGVSRDTDLIAKFLEYYNSHKPI